MKQLDVTFGELVMIELMTAKDRRSYHQNKLCKSKWLIWASFPFNWEVIASRILCQTADISLDSRDILDGDGSRGLPGWRWIFPSNGPISNFTSIKNFFNVCYTAGLIAYYASTVSRVDLGFHLVVHWWASSCPSCIIDEDTKTRARGAIAELWCRSSQPTSLVWEYSSTNQAGHKLSGCYEGDGGFLHGTHRWTEGTEWRAKASHWLSERRCPGRNLATRAEPSDGDSIRKSVPTQQAICVALFETFGRTKSTPKHNLTNP